MNETGLFYDQQIRTHGETPAGLDMGSWESQRRRHRVAIQMMGGIKRGCSITDVGCGFGDFFESFMLSAVPQFSYTGLDVSEEAVLRAKRRGRVGAEFLVADAEIDLIPPADHIVCLGAMYLGADSPAIRLRHQRMMRNLWNNTGKSMVVSFLSDEAPVKNPGETYYHLPHLVSWVMNNLTNRVRVRHDYADHEFMVAMFT